jgi:trk system potassium uptake protein TrkA
MRRFAVLGLASFGTAVARELARLGEHVLAVDNEHGPVEEIKDEVAAAMVADASDRESLVAMGVNRVDVTVVTLSKFPHEATLATLHLASFGVPIIVAKALSADHAEILRKVGATRVVFPERDMAARLADRLVSRNVLDFLAFSANLGVVELSPTLAMIGKTLAEIALGRRFNVQVIAVRELVPEKLVVAPGADFVVKDSDVLLVMGESKDVAALQEA